MGSMGANSSIHDNATPPSVAVEGLQKVSQALSIVVMHNGIWSHTELIASAPENKTEAGILTARCPDCLIEAPHLLQHAMAEAGVGSNEVAQALGWFQDAMRRHIVGYEPSAGGKHPPTDANDLRWGSLQSGRERLRPAFVDCTVIVSEGDKIASGLAPTSVASRSWTSTRVIAKQGESVAPRSLNEAPASAR